ncbi:MAG: sulfatase-like hydrolase/transferase [Planctomycetota bacterium]
MRPGHLPLALLIAASALVSCGREPPPSVLLVTVDTLRADALGCYGSASARTPRMDRLAAEGTRFSRAEANCPLTLPSHATILTGLLPAEHGLRDNDPPHPLPPAELRDYGTLAETLASEGYETAAFVSASVVAARTGLAQGFTIYDGPAEGEPGALRYAERVGGETAALAAEWIRSARRPFFLWVHLFDPHEPYEPPVAFRSGASPGTPEAYADEVAYADRCVGTLLDALDEAGAEGQTLVVVTSDHGEGLGEHGEPTHGYLLYETTLRVPLVLRWPGRVAEGAVREDLVGLEDVAPTIVGAAGGSPAGLLGPPAEDRVVVSESLYGWRHMAWAQLFAAQDGRNRKLVRGSARALYDLGVDPREANPLTEEDAGLGASIDEYRRIRPAEDGGSDAPEPVPGLPYLAGVGRGRLDVVPWEQNEKLRPPDPRLAREIDRAKALVARGAAPAAERLLADLEERDPRNPTVAFWRGRNEGSRGDHASAAKAFSQAFERGLREAKVLDLWLKHLLLGERLEEAGRVIQEVVPEVAPDTGTYLMMAAYHRAVGDVREALLDLDRAAAAARTERERHEVSRFRHNLKAEKDK